MAETSDEVGSILPFPPAPASETQEEHDARLLEHVGGHMRAHVTVLRAEIGRMEEKMNAGFASFSDDLRLVEEQRVAEREVDRTRQDRASKDDRQHFDERLDRVMLAIRSQPAEVAKVVQAAPSITSSDGADLRRVPFSVMVQGSLPLQIGFGSLLVAVAAVILVLALGRSGAERVIHKAPLPDLGSTSAPAEPTPPVRGGGGASAEPNPN